MNCPQTERNRNACNCTYEPCSRKGRCCDCLHYHRRLGELPACYFDAAAEATFDRSLKRCLAARGGGRT